MTTMNTKQRKRSFFGAAAAMGVVLFIAGCGDSANSGAIDGSASNSVTTSGTEQPGGSGSSSMPDESGSHSMPGGGPYDAPAAPTSNAPSEQSVIVIKDFAFKVPDGVPAGATVTVRNDDSVAHTVTSDEEGVFDVHVDPGKEAQLTVPAQPGQYPFHCTPHPNMTATLVVE